MANTETHILVIQLSNINDLIMTIPVLRALRQEYPKVKITILSKNNLQSISTLLPNVDLYVADTKNKYKGLLGLHKLYKNLKQLNITHIADLQDTSISKIFRNLFRINKYHIGVIKNEKNKLKAITRVNNKIFKKLPTIHERYSLVFSNLDFPIKISRLNPIEKPSLPVNLRKIIPATNFNKWIGITPFAEYIGQTYPIDLMEQVIQNLTKENYQLFLFGTKKQLPILNNLAQKYNKVLCTTEKIGGFEDELKLMSNLDLMLSMDNINSHLSSLYGVKTIIIWGNTHPYTGFVPFKQSEEYNLIPDLKKHPNLPYSIKGEFVMEGYENVMRSITPEAIVLKIKSILEH